MRDRKIKFTSALSAMLFLLAAFICLTSVTVSAQTVETGDIIYSRLPVAPNTSGTIWAVRQDGTNDRQIVGGSQPRLSPNNRYLLFRRSQFPSEPYRFGQLFVRDLTTGSETLLITYSDFLVGYDFTPDSMQIVYDDPQFSGIHKINRDGTGQIAVGGSSVADDFPVVRMSDGFIAHHRFDSFATSGIYTLTANGATQQLVPNTLNNLYPSWSPDGQFIAFGSGSLFSVHPYLINNLFKIKPDGSGKVPLTNLATNNNFGTGFVWTANGAKIIVPANLNNVAGLYSVNADGSGAPVLIPTTVGANPDFVGAIAAGQTGGGGNFQLLQSVIAAGGETSGGGNYSMTSTIGEAVAGIGSTGGVYDLTTGFWGGGQSNAPLGRTPFDFDGDGKSDVSVFRPANGVWYLLQSSAGFTGAAFGFETDKLVPADYDGDGKTDLAVYRGGTWYLNRSSLGFTGITFGDGSDIPQPADFDGDGKSELAVFRPSNGTWYVLNLVNNQFSAVQFGQSGDKPVVGDFDGDNKADYAVFRPSSGAWYLQRSGLGFTGFLFGAPTDTPVPADYDGDGKTDVAVFRPSSGTWYLQQSTAGFTGIAFGIATDLPAPADYDGDGKADVAVYRGGSWYLNRSTAGFTGVAFGTATDKPVPNAFVP